MQRHLLIYNGTQDWGTEWAASLEREGKVLRYPQVEERKKIKGKIYKGKQGPGALRCWSRRAKVLQYPQV